MSPSSNSSSTPSNADKWLKLIGILAVLWAAAKIIGWIISPGVVLLAVAAWLILRSKRKSKEQVQPLTSATFMSPTMPGYWAPTHNPAPHAPAGGFAYGWYQPVAAGQMAPGQVFPQSSAGWAPGAPNWAATPPINDLRTPAEREIEENVERSWPN